MDEKDSMDFLDETDRQILLMLKSNSRTASKDYRRERSSDGAGRFQPNHPAAKTAGDPLIQSMSMRKKLGMAMIAYITVFMKTREHQQLQRLLQAEDIVKEVHRISGDGCYLVKVVCPGMMEINRLLDQLMEYGTYRLNLSTESNQRLKQV